MAVTASTIFGRVRSLLDDDNSDRYSETKDLVPAINSAIDYITAVFSAAFETKKVQPEVLSELTEVLLYDVTVNGSTGYVQLNEPDSGTIVYNDVVWTTFGVDRYALVVAGDYIQTIGPLAKRVTLEEWGQFGRDPFSPGNQNVPQDFARAVWTGPGSYYGDDPAEPYLMVVPGSPSLVTEAFDKVAVFVLMKHPEITASSDELLFPVSVHEMIVQKMVNLIAYQHDMDKYLKVSDQAVKELITLMNL